MTRLGPPALLALASLVSGCLLVEDGPKSGGGGTAPLADAGDDAAARLFRPFTLDGSQSTDPDGDDLSYSWVLLAVPEGSSASLDGTGTAQPTLTPDREGVYLAGLTVSDGKSESAMDVVAITVQVRIAVFASRAPGFAAEIEVSGAGLADDHTGDPASRVIGASGGRVLIADERNHVDSLLVYDAALGTLELLAAGEILVAYIEGDHVAWLERRDGRTDVFARDLVTGVETRVTDSPQIEDLAGLGGGVVVWAEIRDVAYGTDTFAFDLATGTEIAVSPPDLAVEETPATVAPTDGATVLYTVNFGDTFAYDLAAQARVPVATSTTAVEMAIGVSGDFAVLFTSGTPPYERRRITDPDDRVALDGTVLAMGDGDVLLADAGTLNAHRLASGSTLVVSSSWTGSAQGIGDGAVAWHEPGSGSDWVLRTMTLPAGAVQTVATGDGPASEPAPLSGGVAWTGPGPNGVEEAFLFPAGGGTSTLLSTGKTFLDDVLDEYDVAVVGGEIFANTEYHLAVLEALDAAGVPVLAAAASGSTLAELFEDEGLHGLSAQEEDCGVPSAVHLAAVAHPAFEGFPPDSHIVLEYEGTSAYDASGLFVSGEDAPADWTVLATFGIPGFYCGIGEDPVLATFTSPAGTPVLLDGALSDRVTFWTEARRRLLRAELRWLASTRAP